MFCAGGFRRTGPRRSRHTCGTSNFPEVDGIASTARRAIASISTLRDMRTLEAFWISAAVRVVLGTS